MRVPYRTLALLTLAGTGVSPALLAQKDRTWASEPRTSLFPGPIGTA
jgi:hypothetical protein